MNIQLISDLHLELYADRGRELVLSLDATNVDVLVLAGDICSWKDHAKAAQTLGWFAAKYPQVVYVPGNHEYWHTHLKYQSKVCQDIHVLHPNVHAFDTAGCVELDGVRFIAGTMWFPSRPDNVLYEREFNDFFLIKGGFKNWVYRENKTFSSYVRNNCRPGDVVVTHHLPSMASVSSRYKTDESNRFFVSPMETVIRENKPSYWLHGHTHSACHYDMYATEVVCNPHGYPTQAALKLNKLVLPHVPKHLQPNGGFRHE